MVQTASTMLSLGVKRQIFSLPDLKRKKSLACRFCRRSRVVGDFLCNHCPYVKHVADVLAKLTKEYQQRE